MRRQSSTSMAAGCLGVVLCDAPRGIAIKGFHLVKNDEFARLKALAEASARPPRTPAASAPPTERSPYLTNVSGTGLLTMCHFPCAS